MSRREDAGGFYVVLYVFRPLSRVLTMWFIYTQADDDLKTSMPT
jgi:hypothetical protein